MPVADWVTTEDWEVLVLAGRRMPGVARVDISVSSGLEVHKPRGKKRARIKDVGAPPCEVSITLELLPDEMASFEGVINLLHPRAAHGSRRALEIAHPNAKMWGVNTIKIGTISSPQPTSGGSYTVTIQAYEHVEEPTSVKKPAAKPHDGTPGDWDVQPLIDSNRPSQMGAPQANFTSGQVPSVNISEGEIPGSGF